MADYKWRKKAFGNAQAVGEELARLHKKRRGQVTTALILQEASDPDSPLHDSFEWDDTEAAREYRLLQGRWMLASIQIEKEDGKREPMFVHVTRESGDKAYATPARVLSNAALFQSARQEIVARLEGVASRLEELDALASKWQAPKVKRAGRGVRAAKGELVNA